jgi:hypothetical protein
MDVNWLLVIIIFSLEGIKDWLGIRSGWVFELFMMVFRVIALVFRVIALVFISSIACNWN